jgi:acyl-CoA thioesterase FadM
MARTRIVLPDHFGFSCTIPVRITDINYGGHTGNDTILSLIHEARMQYLKSLGYTEMNFGGVGMIMSDVVIEFRSELFYGDIIEASVTCGDISKVGFEIFYKLEVTRDNKILAAVSKTGMVCYDYARENRFGTRGSSKGALRLISRKGTKFRKAANRFFLFLSASAHLVFAVKLSYAFQIFQLCSACPTNISNPFLMNAPLALPLARNNVSSGL